MHYPNVIIILCDTLAAKHMSLYGYSRQTTPYLERLANEDFKVYSRCFSPAPWTAPSHASLFTGLYPSQHKTDGANYQLDKSFRQLTELFKSRNYTTIIISNNILIANSLTYGKAADFFYELWRPLALEDFRYIEEILDIQDYNSIVKKFLFILKQFVSNFDFNYLKFLYRKILERNNKVQKKLFRYSYPFTQNSLYKIVEIARSIDSPFFVFCNIMETHEKFNPPPNFRNVFDTENDSLTKAHLNEPEEGKIHYGKRPLSKEHLYNLELLYDEEVLALDKLLFDFISKLKELSCYNETIIIITSDHGEFTGENGHFGHLYTTANELIHVPFLIKGCKLCNDFDHSDQMIQIHDIYSTFLDILDLPYPKTWSSHSLLDSDKRKFIIAQLLDINFKLEGIKEINPNFTRKSFMQPVMSVVTSDLFKVSKWYDGKIEFIDLNKTFYEEKPTLLTDVDKKERLKKLITFLDTTSEFSKSASHPII